MRTSDDSEVVVHSNDVDAPVLLLVPHTWHLEDKDYMPVLPDPAPLVVSPSSPRALHPRGPFSLHHPQDHVAQGTAAVCSRLQQMPCDSAVLLLPADANPASFLATLPPAGPAL